MDDQGELAPGKIADIVILDDVETVDVVTVISDGRRVMEDRDVLVNPYKHNYRDFIFDTVEVVSRLRRSKFLLTMPLDLEFEQSNTKKGS